ncbi:unnamed protein product, partial [Amoebophrya sp. A25]|eukprot:GSA25T00015773001.1
MKGNRDEKSAALQAQHGRISSNRSWPPSASDIAGHREPLAFALPLRQTAEAMRETAHALQAAHPELAWAREQRPTRVNLDSLLVVQQMHTNAPSTLSRRCIQKVDHYQPRRSIPTAGSRGKKNLIFEEIHRVQQALGLNIVHADLLLYSSGTLLGWHQDSFSRHRHLCTVVIDLVNDFQATPNIEAERVVEAQTPKQLAAMQVEEGGKQVEKVLVLAPAQDEQVIRITRTTKVMKEGAACVLPQPGRTRKASLSRRSSMQSKDPSSSSKRVTSRGDNRSAKPRNHHDGTTVHMNSKAVCESLPLEETTDAVSVNHAKDCGRNSGICRQEWREIIRPDPPKKGLLSCSSQIPDEADVGSSSTEQKNVAFHLGSRTYALPSNTTVSIHGVTCNNNMAHRFVFQPEKGVGERDQAERNIERITKSKSEDEEATKKSYHNPEDIKKSFHDEANAAQMSSTDTVTSLLNKQLQQKQPERICVVLFCWSPQLQALAKDQEIIVDMHKWWTESMNELPSKEN